MSTQVQQRQVQQEASTLPEQTEYWREWDALHAPGPGEGFVRRTYGKCRDLSCAPLKGPRKNTWYWRTTGILLTALFIIGSIAAAQSMSGIVAGGFTITLSLALLVACVYALKTKSVYKQAGPLALVIMAVTAVALAAIGILATRGLLRATNVGCGVMGTLLSGAALLTLTHFVVKKFFPQFLEIKKRERISFDICDCFKKSTVHTA